jgi:2-dehydropantoate 2-reductase
MTELLIVGTGAMALLFGSRLASAGINVSFLGSWKEGITALKENGIRVAGPEGERVYPVRVFSDPAEISQIQLALILVKSWQTEKAAAQLSQVLGPEGLALTLQNGLGNLEILSDVLGMDRVAQGVTTSGATLLEPGLVQMGGEGLISIQEHPRLLVLLELFQRAELSVQQLPDLTSMIWGKLVINVAINPITALLGVRNGVLLESKSARQVMGQAADEAAEVARAMGIELKFSDPLQAAEAVAEATADNKSSMLQDINRGAPTEIDVLCGAVTRLGLKYQVGTPTNQLLWHLVKARADLAGKKDL